MKKFNLKQLSLSMATAIGLAVAGTSVTTSQASDIEIYTVPDKAQKIIVMMLDTSGSMVGCDVKAVIPMDWPSNGGWIKASVSYSNLNSVDYFNNGFSYSEANKAELRKYVGRDKSNTTPSYDRAFCYGQDGYFRIDTRTKHYDRMTKLKDAVFALMDSNQLDDSIHIAVGQFSGNGKGSIKIEAAPLTQEHRTRIKTYVAGLGGSGPTPTASSFAEAAAYFMGTNTVVENPKIEHTRQLWVAKDPNNLSTYYYCGRKDARPSKLTDPISELNVDATGACTGIAGSTLTKNFNDAKNNEGFTGAQKCRGLNGLVWTGAKNVDTYCLYKANDTITVNALGDDYNNNYSGFAQSVVATKQADLQNYKSPLPAVGRECSGQAIYFLTDGEPNNANNSQYLMRAALGNKAGDFPTVASAFSDTTKYLESTNDEGMGPASELAKRLNNPALNPQGVSIKTALVGFGADFIEAKDKKVTLVDNEGKPREYYNCSKIEKRTIKNACNFAEKSHPDLKNVGGYGEGGFFYAEDAKDVINSFLSVAKDIKTKFSPVTTGAPTIPVDALLVGRVSDTAYYGSFTPRPDLAQQLWTGDMNKYSVTDGVLKNKAGDNLFRADGSLNSVLTGLWDDGLKSKLALQNQANIASGIGRIIFTNRKMEGGVAKNSTELQTVTVEKLYTGSLKEDTTKRNYWLNALGYNVGETEEVAQNKLSEKAELRQVGATMHSSPILLTQKGLVETQRVNGVLQPTVKENTREDYLLFGSTQGILHVVDSKTGKEKFAFIPNEMIERQPQALLAETSTAGGRANMFYGIDAPWVAHTQYVPVSDRDTTLTVGDSELTEDDNEKSTLNLRGVQWVYGGLRMGGQSYYALDLANMNAPKMKFHIDPATQTIHTGDEALSYPQLQHMGQSWSKPTLGYVRWNGQRKLVMFVGGGYDTGYENTTYQQTNGKGAGVYMFDAANGKLLWWASSHNTTGNNVRLTQDANLRYSVVSRINTLDRDGDGLVDNLYFGDLGGQVFRIDLNNESQKTENNTASFGHRVTRIMNENKTDGKSPRFYNMPSLSVHTASGSSGNGQRFLVVALGSGDSSSPLAGIEKSVQGASRTRETAEDGVYVIYDNDVGKTSLFTSSFTAEPLADNGRIKVSNFTDGVPQVVTENGKTLFNRGWKYTFPDNTQSESYGRYKVLNDAYALTDLLFVNVYNKDENGNSSACGGGVRGTTYLYQYCLPTGRCEQDKHGFETRASEMRAKVGSGNINTALGGGPNTSIVNTGGGGAGGAGGPENPFNTKWQQPASIKQLRWYESR
ncbi:PilC/PilY family type IV pilus protein [Moraxella sp. ZY210820]|uniref:PilC/PilY family type IV pilus protein n=1 Tax=unclassified Moraxella TaxID=2685852 RepID=UPI00272EED9D|nr:PilC/PilY family type IV pilus protein [Moraxella sp. ZY210820]WLF83588.1 pilus assembly protein PilY [Moraxella sp. ZY210820]